MDLIDSQREYDFDDLMNINEASSVNNIPGLRETMRYRPKYAKDIKDKEKKPKSLISKFFSDMARMGMNYEEDVIKNMRAVPADLSLLPKEKKPLSNLFATNWKQKSDKDKDFFEKDFAVKRDLLRKLAVQPELEDILDTMTNESIVYDADYTYFAEPFIEVQEMEDMKPDLKKRIYKSLNYNFRKFYKMLNWKYNAWDDYKRWLIEGALAWEIVYDSLSKPTKIIGIIPIDVCTLTKKFENNKWYWVQYKGNLGKERKLLDSQVIYISYQETNAINRCSYLERLIRPFNIYRIVEQAQLIWLITNASYKMKFVIPVRGMSVASGKQHISKIMNDFNEDIDFNLDSGELKINGKPHMQFNKEYWLPESDSGSPDIETIGGDGPDLMDNDQLKYFKNQLYKISKIPLSRFDQESGETWFGTDATSVARVEIDFARFVNRMRNTFSQVIIKPLQMQLALDIEELRDNRQFLEAISLQYKSYNLFEEMMEMELMSKRVEFIQNMKDSLVDMDANGSDVKFFSSEFLVRKYLKISDADLKINDKLKARDDKEMIDNVNDVSASQIDVEANVLEDDLNSKKVNKTKNNKSKKSSFKDINKKVNIINNKKGINNTEEEGEEYILNDKTNSTEENKEEE